MRYTNLWSQKFKGKIDQLKRKDVPCCPLQNLMNQYHVLYPHHPRHHHVEGLPPEDNDMIMLVHKQ